MDVRVGLWRRLSPEELMLLNCGVREDLRVPWTARRSSQSILKEISPGCSLEGLMLKFQYFGHLMWRSDSFEKTLMLGMIEGRRRRDWQDEMVGWYHRLNGHGFGWALGVGDGQGGLACCGSWGCKELDMTEWLNWSDNSNRSTGFPRRRAKALFPVMELNPSHHFRVQLVQFTLPGMISSCLLQGLNLGLGRIDLDLLKPILRGESAPFKLIWKR